MKKQEIKFEYLVYSTLKDAPEAIQSLIVSAKTAIDKAYAPYSGFKVGAAIRLADEQIISGSNQENSSYPLCLCAERVALAAVSSVAPNEIITAIAVTAKSPSHLLDTPVTPCGACRQVMVEAEQRQKQPMQVILTGETGPIYVFESATQLLPFSFDASYL